MNNYIFLLTLLLIQGISFWIGNKESKNLSSKEEYFLAGKSLSFFPLMMSFVATQVGGASILGASEEAYHVGLAALLYPLGISLGLVLLGYGPGKKLAAFSFLTISELLEKSYSSKFLRKLASVLSIITLFLILIAQVIASKKFLATLGFVSPLWVILLWGVLVFYTSIGGLKAVVKTDVIQAIFLIISLFVCGWVGYSSGSFNFQGFLSVSTGSVVSCRSLLVWFFSPLLFLFIEQDMAQRCFASKSPKILKKAAIFSSLIIIALSCVPIFFGMLLKKNGLSVIEGQSVFMTAVMFFTNPWFSGFIGCSVLVAIMSTADSLINSIGSMLANDFIQIENKAVSYFKIISLFISIVAAFLASYFSNIVSLVVFSYGLSISCLLVPIMGALLINYSFSFFSALLSVIFGGVTFLLVTKGFLTSFFFPVDVFSIFISLLGFVFGEILYILRRKALRLENR